VLILGLIVVGIILCFGFVLLFGAPYLPTLSKQVTLALDMADLKPGQTLLELGCGDGKVVVAAAQRGYKVVGYELNPLLVLLCKVRTWRYGHLVRIYWGNFMTHQWPECDAIFVFGLQRIMPRLDTKIMQSINKSVNPASLEGGQVNVVSFAFTFPGRKAVQKVDGLSLYRFETL